MTYAVKLDRMVQQTNRLVGESKGRFADQLEAPISLAAA